MKVTNTSDLSNRFAYRPTRRRFLHAAFGLPVAATLLPLLMPKTAEATVGTGDITPHKIKFVTPNGKDPGTKMVFVFMQGGLSFFDTFDPKTHSTIKGPFSVIPTAAKEVKFTEPLTPLAKHANKFIVINNLYTNDSDHDRGAAIVLTGSSKVVDGSFYADSIYTNPFIEFSNLLTEQASKDIGYVVLHQSTKDSGSSGNGRLWDKPWGAIKHNDPETIYSAYDTQSGQFANPFRGSKDFPIELYRERMKLLELLSASGHTLVGSSVEKHDRAYGKANSLLDGDFNKSFDLVDESATALVRYGDSQVGKQFLLARRMLERGARVVAVNDGNYDHHTEIESNMNSMIRKFAQGLGAFLDDIEKIDDKVLVVIATEFGRTPVVNLGKGRDHWPGAFGLVIAGNHIDGGRVIGKTNDKGDIVGSAYDASLTGETILNLMGLGRFETRGEVVTGKRFPYIDIKKAG